VGEDREYLADLARECGVSDRVHMLGHVAPDDLPRWYNAADVFAMPNREINGDTEGFGMVFLEAAACGKPVVAGKSGGTAAAVEHEVTGLRVDGNSQSEVAEGLGRLLSDSAFAIKLGMNGCARVQERFSWEATVAKTKAMIAQL
jgi:phosphatidylinositol alpha-1,6-mannosyltransferase